MRTSQIIRRSIVGLLFGVSIWFYAKTFFRPNWGWPLSVLFGFVCLLVLIFIVRKVVNRPAPFQLVLRLANDKGGDEDDDATFTKLHKRFKDAFRGCRDVRFDGYDTDRSWIWFYFFGPNEQTVREVVLSELRDCKIRAGSYFLSAASQSCAPPTDGPALQL